MSRLIEVLAAELERPRELSGRVVNYISGHYGIDDDALGRFLTDQLPELEDDEVDLILSPLFTPKLADQVIFAEALGQDSVPRQQWPALIEELSARPTRTPLITPDGRSHVVILREVTLERYVHRLRLDATIPTTLFELLKRMPTQDRPMLKAIARRAAWDDANVREILSRYLELTFDDGSYCVSEAMELLELVESRKPASVSDLLARIPGWQESLRQQIDVARQAKPFFHDEIRALHGGGRDRGARPGTMRTCGRFFHATSN